MPGVYINPFTDFGFKRIFGEEEMKHLHEFERIPATLQTKILEKVFRIAEFTALSKEDKLEYEESLKVYNDLKNSLDTAEYTGFQKAEEKYVPLLEEERRQKEKAQARIAAMIQKRLDKGMSFAEIASDLDMDEDEIIGIVEKFNGRS